MTSPEIRRAVAVKAARDFLNKPPQSRGLTFEPDPVGFVRAAWWEAGLDLFERSTFQKEELHGMAMLYRSALARKGLFQGPPQPGDLVFLGPSQSEDAPFPTQVGLVESVDPSGTVYVLGRFAGGPRRIALHLKQKDKTSEQNGQLFNDMLEGRQTAGNLFWSYGLPY